MTSRRAWMKGVGAGGTLAYLLPQLRSRSAHAQTSDIPCRLVIFYSYHGTLPQFWFPATATGSNWTMPDLMMPFAAYKKDTVVFDGLSMKSHDIDNGANGNAHQQGQAHALTAANMAPNGLAGGISIDQAIAKQIGAKTKFPSLELFASSDSGSGHWTSSVGPGQLLPMERDPRKAFTRLFPNGSPTSGSSTPMDTSKLLDRKKSVLDAVWSEYDTLGKKLSNDARTKLETHAALIRDIEKGLMTTTPVPSGATCAAPAKAPIDAVTNPSDTLKTFDLHAQLAAAALGCDLTRVVTVNFDELPNSVCGYTDGQYNTPNMHELIHGSDPQFANLMDVTRSPEALATTKKYYNYYSTAFAKLLGYLKAIPERDGKSLLDHSIVLWAGEIARGWHDTHRLPWVTVGSGGGQIATDRVLKLNDAPHNNLFVSLAKLMGANLTTFGNSACTGALAGFAG